MSDNHNGIDEELLIKRLLAGDEQSYRQLVKSCHAAMYSFARAIVGDGIADEVVQEAWLAVIRALPGFQRRSSLKTWILRIVSNTAKNRLRKESRLAAMEDIEGLLAMDDRPEPYDQRGHWLPGAGPASWHHVKPDDILATEQLCGRLQDTIATLPPLQRAALTLRDMEGIDFADICKILDVSESNVRVLVHRARARLREVIDIYEKE